MSDGPVPRFLSASPPSRSVERPRPHRRHATVPPWFEPVFGEAMRVWKGDAPAVAFLDRPHPLLGGSRPWDVAWESEQGADAVLKILGRLAHGTAA